MKPYSDITDPRLIKALAHPLRIRILAILEDRELASPNELSELLGVSLGVMSYHVRRLHALGFLELVKRTPRRGAIEHHYRAKARPKVSDEGWAETPAIVKRAMVGASLEQVSGYVNAAAAKGGFDNADAHLSRSVIQLDEQGWKELAGEMAKTLATIEKIEAESAERLRRTGDDDAAERSAGIVLMMFQAEGVAEEGSANGGEGQHLGRRSSRRPRPLHAAGVELD
ncbi:winged helix-turn-helix domain-containing protein [Conexibacter woesei]|uniref:Transcriptional regulator, ArsR family n=1 Tax=Conexibacter woesei (strain DSM 14684 / CCUG 47730 / CIP 108061 / JCM 11494 / NBRC 100937 / ID131577) TaxID=469383 RepID=D3F1A8_CONWI|nr:winged helix-turn-helix domain-containing protein [Conexibacter woesei]ADB52071.1 transcriptional regulator, ArsR family [Conexibacter woesei DSM 14684]